MSNFDATNWNLVAAAGDKENPDSSAALAELCEIYWYPLYAYARRRVQDDEAARDLTQGFFAELLERNYIAVADQERGKFRSFLLSGLQRYMNNQWERQRAQKRGGGRAPLSLDLDTAENGYKLEPADDRTPEDVFEETWATTLLGRADRRLRREMLESGKKDRFELLAPFVIGDGADAPYKQVAETLNLSEGAVKVAIHRMRKRFGDILRAEVADTVGHEDDVDEELRHVLALAGPH